VTIRPFDLTDCGPDAFVAERMRLSENKENAALLGRLFQAIRDKKPFTEEGT